MFKVMSIYDQATETELAVRSAAIEDEEIRLYGNRMYSVDIEDSRGDLCLFNMPIVVETSKNKSPIYYMPALADIIDNCYYENKSFDFDSIKKVEMFEARLDECLLYAPVHTKIIMSLNRGY